MNNNMQVVKTEGQALAEERLALQRHAQNLEQQLALANRAREVALETAAAATKSRKRKRAGQLPVSWLKPPTFFKRGKDPEKQTLEDFTSETPMRLKQEPATWLDHVVSQDKEDVTYKRPGTDGKTNYPNDFKAKLKTIMVQAMKIRLYGAHAIPK